MALAEEKNLESYAAQGTPDSDTAWNKLDFGFKSEGLKIIIPAGTVDISFNGEDLFATLANADAVQYDFVGMHIPRIWVRGTSAVGLILIAWAGE